MLHVFSLILTLQMLNSISKNDRALNTIPVKQSTSQEFFDQNVFALKPPQLIKAIVSSVNSSTSDGEYLQLDTCGEVGWRQD